MTAYGTPYVPHFVINSFPFRPAPVVVVPRQAPSAPTPSQGKSPAGAKPATSAQKPGQPMKPGQAQAKPTGNTAAQHQAAQHRERVMANTPHINQRALPIKKVSQPPLPFNPANNQHANARQLIDMRRSKPVVSQLMRRDSFN